MLRNAFLTMAFERPSRLRPLRWLRGFFIEAAATPPHEAMAFV